MTEITNFAQARAVLMSYMPPDTRRGNYTLERMSKLMNELGNPQDKLKVIHVAGTSGKTSTAYYLSALLQASGQKIGLTVSPHIDEVNERVQIDLKPLSETAFCKELSVFIEIVDKTGIKPTYFELLVAFAYWTFAKEKVDYAVVEVGLGGLLDGTNVVTRQDKVCVITDIGLDHTEVLGNTLAAIAAQKSGVIQTNNRVIMYKQAPEVMQVVHARCVQKEASLFMIARLDLRKAPPSPDQIWSTANCFSSLDVSTDTSLSDKTIGTNPDVPWKRRILRKSSIPAAEYMPQDLPPFQQRNWHLAKTTAEYIYNRDNLVPPGKQGVANAIRTLIPARMEVVKYQGQTVIIDGSHNEQKMAALAAGMHKLYAGKPIAALVSFVQSEHQRAAGALKQLHKLTNTLIITSFSGHQDTPKHSVDPKRTAEAAQKIGFRDIIIIDDPEKAFSELLKRAEPVKLVTGSFYLLNHIRPLIFVRGSTSHNDILGKMIRAIVAIDEKRGMANDEGIPWHAPSDIKYYREKTSTGAILMGYGTYVEFKHPFHDHLNYVATKKPERLREGFESVYDARQFLQGFGEDIWVIGGAGLLEHTIDLMDELYITQLHGDWHCTKFFPEFKQRFELASEGESITENNVTFTFQTWKRKTKRGKV